jgi:hypothetical protein
MCSSAACWTAGQPAPYLHLARTFDLVEREKGKIKTTAILCNMLRRFLNIYLFLLIYIPAVVDHPWNMFLPGQKG